MDKKKSSAMKLRLEKMKRRKLHERLNNIAILEKENQQLVEGNEKKGDEIVNDKKDLEEQKAQVVKEKRILSGRITKLNQRLNRPQDWVDETRDYKSWEQVGKTQRWRKVQEVTKQLMKSSENRPSFLAPLLTAILQQSKVSNVLESPMIKRLQEVCGGKPSLDTELASNLDKVLARLADPSVCGKQQHWRARKTLLATCLPCDLSMSEYSSSDWKRKLHCSSKMDLTEPMERRGDFFDSGGSLSYEKLLETRPSWRKIPGNVQLEHKLHEWLGQEPQSRVVPGCIYTT